MAFPKERSSEPNRGLLAPVPVSPAALEKANASVQQMLKPTHKK
jgi:hypothetical protein